MPNLGSVTNFFPTPFENSVTMTLGGTIAPGAATVPVNGMTNYSDNQIVVFTVDAATPSLKQVFTGTKAGTNVTNVVWTYGTNQTHTTGASVIDYVSSSAVGMISKGIQVEHNQDGTHKIGATSTLTSTKVVTGLRDTNGKNMLDVNPIANSVNEVQLSNAATGGDPTLAAVGTDANINLALNPKGTGVVKVDGSVPRSFFALFDFIESGCVISGTGYGATLGWSMTAGVVWINGQRLTVASASGTVTATKDTYFDLLAGSGTASVVNTGGNIVANNAASPALAANSVRFGIVVSGANIAAATSVNQGQEDRVLPVASAINYSVTDSLGNLICPRDPQRKLLSYRVATTGTYAISNTTPTYLTGATCPVIVPAGRKVLVTVTGAQMYNSGTAQSSMSICSGVTAGAVTNVLFVETAGANTAAGTYPIHLSVPTTPSGTVFYTATGNASSSGTSNFTGIQIRVELV